MKTLSLLAVSAVLAATALTTVHATSMQEAVAQAISTHPDVLRNEKNRDAIGHKIDEARAGFRPTLDVTMGTGWEQSMNNSTRNRPGRGSKSAWVDLWRNEARVVGRQMLFDGHQTASQMMQQKMRFESANFHIQDVRNVIALRAIEAYLDVLRTRELVALNEDSLKTHLDLMDRIQTRVNAGRSSGADVQQAQGRVALAKANLEAAKGDEKTAEAAYLEAVGAMPNNPVKPDAPFASMPGNTRAAIDRAMANSPVIKSGQADIAAAKAEKAEAECRFCPRIEAELSASRNKNLDGTKGWNDDNMAMIYYRQNLYNGGHDVAQVAERESVVQGAVDQLEFDRRQLEKAVIGAYTDMQTAQARLEPLAAHVEAAQATRNAFSEQFDLGQRTLLDLLDSEVELVNARAALITGKYQADAGAYGVLAYTGDLVPAAAPAQMASK